MSIESLNSENRNYGTTFPIRGRCSYCRIEGHNILTCNHYSLLLFQMRCLENYMILGSDINFKNWLLEFSIINRSLVKSYAIRWCGCSSRNNIIYCVETIVRKIRGVVSDNYMEIINYANYEDSRNVKFNIQTKIVCCEKEKDENIECNICYENYEKKSFIKLNCSHEFCKECMKKTLKSSTTNSVNCALCRTEINEFEISNQEIIDEFDDLINPT